jgi:ADP-ribose diphosphatase
MIVLMGIALAYKIEYRRIALLRAIFVLQPALLRRYVQFILFGYTMHHFGRGTMATKKPATAKILSSEIAYKGRVFGIRRDEVLEPSGVRTSREFITHPGSVVVLPVLPDGKIVLIRQYRHAARQYMWELVAGRIDAGESPKKAAARELIEETGYRAKKFKIFLDIFPSPGFLEERMYILLAEQVTPGEAKPEEDEKIEPKSCTRRELERMIGSGKIIDAKTIAGLLYYFQYLAKR